MKRVLLQRDAHRGDAAPEPDVAVHPLHENGDSGRGGRTLVEVWPVASDTSAVATTSPTSVMRHRSYAGDRDRPAGSRRYTGRGRTGTGGRCRARRPRGANRGRRRLWFAVAAAAATGGNEPARRARPSPATVRPEVPRLDSPRVSSAWSAGRGLGPRTVVRCSALRPWTTLCSWSRTWTVR